MNIMLLHESPGLYGGFLVLTVDRVRTTAIALGTSPLGDPGKRRVHRAANDGDVTSRVLYRPATLKDVDVPGELDDKGIRHWCIEALLEYAGIEATPDLIDRLESNLRL